MSRHRLSGPENETAATADDAPTGPLALPGPRVVLVPRAPAELIAPAAPSSSGAAVAASTPPALSFDDRARAWADAPGQFARPWGIPGNAATTGPAVAVEAPLLLPPDSWNTADGWGPWPPDATVARPRSVPLPVVSPVAAVPSRRGPTVLMIGTIVVLVGMLAVLGVALVRPDLVGFPGGPLFATGGDPAPGVAEVVPGAR